jgi:hypothetical protein
MLFSKIHFKGEIVPLCEKGFNERGNGWHRRIRRFILKSVGSTVQLSIIFKKVWNLHFSTSQLA